MPSINTWVFSGSGQLTGGGYEFPAQTFTIAISANGVVAEDTRLATGDSKLASPFELMITNGDTVVRYDGSEAKSVTLSAGPQGEMGPTGPTGPAGKDGFTPTGGALTTTSVLYNTTNGATLTGPLVLQGTPNNITAPFAATLTYAGLTNTQNYTITGILAKPVPTTLDAIYTGSTAVGTEVTAANWSYTVKDQYGNTITPGGTLVQSPNFVTLVEGDNIIGLTLMYATGQLSVQKTIVGVPSGATSSSGTAQGTGGNSSPFYCQKTSYTP